MKGWILFKEGSGFIKNKSYAVSRLMESAEEFGVELQLISPDRLDLTVTREDRKVYFLMERLSPFQTLLFLEWARLLPTLI